MKIVSILGSPRSAGNSTYLADTVTRAAAEAGAEVERFQLNRLQYRGCQACGACKGKSEICVLEDDLREVLAAVVDADVVLLATPVYWGDISGQLKLFLDRTYSYLKPGFQERHDHHRLPPGKKLVWVQAQGAEDNRAFAGIFERYNSFFTQLKYFDRVYTLMASGVNAIGAVKDNAALIAEAEQIGRQLTSG